MSIIDAATAVEWARTWVRDRAERALQHGRDGMAYQAMNLRRFRRVAEEQDGLALMCKLRQPTAAEGYHAAATALREMATNVERDMRALGLDPETT